MTPLRLALLHSDDHHHRYLAALLSRRFELALVVVEPARERATALRRHGRFRTWAYHGYQRGRRALTGRDRYRRRYFAHEPRVWTGPGPGRLDVTSVNDGAVAAALRVVTADVVVVIGCSPLSRATLTAAGPLVLTVHGGVLPHYRGDHGAFFAVYDGHPDRVGATIHRADLGAGTGELIEVVRPPMRGDESPMRLRCLADLIAIHRLIGWLEILERGGELPSCPQPPAAAGAGVRDRGPLHDLRYLLRRYARAARLAGSRQRA